MDDLPETIGDERELDEWLSRPSARLVEFARGLEGDLVVLGAGGKIGPTLVRMAARALEAAGAGGEVVAVDQQPLGDLGAPRVRTVICDLLDPAAVDRLPRAPDVVFMAGRKFGSTGDEPATWAANVLVPYHAARSCGGSRVVVFSTGCVYPLVDAAGRGATEQTPPDPVGEYSMSCLGRERVFDYVSRAAGQKVLHLRLNYAVELRYGVLVDVATRVWRGEPVDLATAWANVIWQGDVCERALLALGLASRPPRALNVTGPEKISVRDLAETFGRLLGRPARFTGADSGRAYLSDASESVRLFGPPRVPLGRVIRWTADWVRRGGRTLGKPTHFEVQDGRF